jgi:hypothetical protein
MPAPDETNKEPVRPALEGADSTFMSPESPEPTPVDCDPPAPDIIDTIPPVVRVEDPPKS